MNKQEMLAEFEKLRGEKVTIKEDSHHICPDLPYSVSCFLCTSPLKICSELTEGEEAYFLLNKKVTSKEYHKAIGAWYRDNKGIGER